MKDKSDYKKKEIQKQEILLLEFCKILKAIKRSKRADHVNNAMSTQHAPAVRVIRVMDSIPWVRCASGNVILFYPQNSYNFALTIS